MALARVDCDGAYFTVCLLLVSLVEVMRCRLAGRRAERHAAGRSRRHAAEPQLRCEAAAGDRPPRRRHARCARPLSCRGVGPPLIAVHSPHRPSTHGSTQPSASHAPRLSTASQAGPPVALLLLPRAQPPPSLGCTSSSLRVSRAGAGRQGRAGFAALAASPPQRRRRRSQRHRWRPPTDRPTVRPCRPSLRFAGIELPSFHSSSSSTAAA